MVKGWCVGGRNLTPKRELLLFGVAAKYRSPEVGDRVKSWRSGGNGRLMVHAGQISTSGRVDGGRTRRA